SGWSRLARSIKSVVLPAPLGPTSPMRSRASTRNETPRKISSAPYDLLSSDATTIDIALSVYARHFARASGILASRNLLERQRWRARACQAQPRLESKARRGQCRWLSPVGRVALKRAGTPLPCAILPPYRRACGNRRLWRRLRPAT